MYNTTLQNIGWKTRLYTGLFIGMGSCFAVDSPTITLPPLIPLGPADSGASTAPLPPPAGETPSLGASSDTSTAAPSPGQEQEKMVERRAPQNRISKFYATAFVDHWGPAVWEFTSTP